MGTNNYFQATQAELRAVAWNPATLATLLALRHVLRHGAVPGADTKNDAVNVPNHIGWCCYARVTDTRARYISVSSTMVGPQNTAAIHSVKGTNEIRYGHYGYKVDFDLFLNGVH